MTTIHAAPTPHGPRLRRNAWAMIVLATTGIVVMVANGQVRSLEASAAGQVAGLVASGPTYVWAAHHSYYWNVGRSGVTGLTVTSECTSAFTLGPLLIAAGILFTWRRPPLLRMPAAVTAATAIAVAGNMTRLALVTWATDRFGREGFSWSHTYAGTLITIFTVIAALITLTRVALPQPSRRPQPGPP